MEIPTAVIHRIQSSLREAAGAPDTDAAPDPPFPSVADAVAAFDSGAASAEVRCGRCGAAGGLLRGAKSALCVYCGCPRRGEDAEGGGLAFRDGAAYRWLLGSLGLDGSESVEFDSDTTGSNKSNEAPNSGMIISDLLDLKLTCLPENKEASTSSTTKEQSSSVDSLNLSAANLDSFFIERKEEMTSAAAPLPQTYTVVQEKKITDSKSHESSRSEVHAASKGLMSSQRTNQVEANPAFASWDADFQSASSGSAAGDSNQPDLFKSSSAAESLSFPDPVIAINPAVGTENKTNMKSAILEHHSEDLASASGTLFDDNLSNQKVAPILESNSGTIPENNALEFTDSSLNMNFAKSDQLPGRDDTGVNDDEAFDDWQDFAGSGNQGSLSNAEHIVEPLKRDSSEIETIDPLPVGTTESTNNANEDSSDDWQAFASISGQGGDIVKSVEGSTSGHGQDLVGSFGEKMSSISLEHSSEVNPVDLWPVGNDKAQNTAEMGKEANDSFDDWQDFATSSKVQAISLNQTGDMMEVPKASHKETDMDSWFMGDFKEPGNTGIVNGNMLDDWQGFTGSDQAQQNSSSTGGEMMSALSEQQEGTVSVQSWVHDSNKEAAKTSSTNVENDTYDIWQDFTKSGHLQENVTNLGREVTSVSPEPAKQIDSLDLWLTSNFKESKSSEGAGRIDASSDGWQDFASFDQTQTSTKIPGEGHLGKNPPGTETLDLWASSHANEMNLEQISDNNDLFDDWQDFQNSRPQQTNLQVPSDASLFDIPSASRPDALGGLASGNILQLASSENQKDKKEDSNEAKSVPSDEHLKSTNGMQHMDNVDPLSLLWPTNNNAIRKQESVNTSVEQLLAQMHDLSFMLKDELSVPDKPVDHSKP
ncbi:hypothetical protein SEVIR_6G173400v4 [Setaria viridis]|uniref:DUF7815 domain-containing protein n=1 Tax=Setaria viridis TaxID=4556 RepID=A0A4U6U7P6_SETVI|nr:uncharacterized protein LOC117859836 [Setaria viridis]TKW10564.1 hypothetical protein SEVIR_6G173400v2 [Setaria viridis]TKW10565.1 hypothetical protein SEVIR_6G173400v2 [Setaria viridis]